MSKNKFLVGKPKFYPDKLINEFKKLFFKLPNVKSAYIAQIFIPNSGIPAHPVIGINIQGNLNDIANELGEVIKGNTKKGEYIDVFPADTKGLAEYFATIEPFYQRRKNKIATVSNEDE